MNKFLCLFLVVIIVGFTSCIDVIEQLNLKKDGSGTYSLTIDMGGIMSGGMLGMLQGAMEDEMGGEDDINPEGDNIITREKEGEAPASMEKDSTIYFKDLSADEKSKLSDPSFFDKVSVNMVMSESDEKFQIKYNLNFDNLGDIDYFYQNFSSFNPDFGEDASGMDNMLGGGGGAGGLIPSGGNTQLFSMKGKTLKRYESEGNAMGDLGDEMGGKEMEGMMRMMFAGAKYKMIYNLPGKVKKSSNKEYEVNGNSVMMEVGFLDIMDQKAKMATTIKFKN